MTVKKKKLDKETNPSLLGKREIQKMQFQKDILLYTHIFTQRWISLHLCARTHFYILLQLHICITYKIFKSDVVTLYPSLTVN